MLTSCKLTGSAAKLAAYHSSEENYYFAQAAGVEALGGEVGGGPHIHGGLAQALGFKDGAAITERDLRNLLSSRNAAGELVAREHQVIGVDLTFSAPKSVSIAGLLTDRDPAIIAAHDRAVLDTMREIEKHCGETRRRDNGGPPKPFHTGNMAYATVRDGFNREHDPHLHTHVVVMNMTKLGREILSLNGRKILRHDFNKLWGSMYRANLAANLKEAGYSVSYTKKGELRLDSVSLELEREFSTRRAEIVKAKDRGLHDMAAWRGTRKEKDPKVEKTNILESWRARVELYQAKTVEQNRADVKAERAAWSREASFSIEARQELAGERGNTEAARWQAAARRATERTATVTANAIITEYMTEVARGEAWAHITYAEAEQRLMAEVRAGHLLATDDGRFTTWELTRADRECVRERQAPAALALAADAAARQVGEYVGKHLEGGRRSLSEQQAAVAAGILSAERGTVVVQGDAGAGKTTMLKAVHEIAGQKGWETVGLAIQGVAARNLQEASGISSMTVSSYLARERAANRLEPGETLTARAPRLIVIDEASMLDSRGLAQLMGHADKHGDKVVLVGDRNQIQSVGAGRPFDRLVETAEASGQLLNLSENYRQRNPDLRAAVELARGGKMRDSMDVLNRTGRVEEIRDTGARRVTVAKLYDKNTLILTGSRESREVLNGLIRLDLAHKGIVDRTTAITYKLSWADADGVGQSYQRELAKGDVVTFLKNDYRKDLDVRNGERGVVVSTSRDGVAVRLEDGRTVKVDVARYGALDYGYAMTTYKAQGQTFDKVVVEADTTVPVLQDSRNTYVQITRARDDIRVFTDDKLELREASGVLNFRQDTFGIENVSLEKAAAMEARVRTEAFGERARQEAGAKISQAEAWASQAAGKLQQSATGIPEKNPVEAERGQPRALNVSNETLLRGLGDNEAAREQWKERFAEVTAKLSKAPGLTAKEKQLVADELGKPECVSALHSCVGKPDYTVAFGAMKAEVGDLPNLTKGIAGVDYSEVKKLVQWANYEKDRVPLRDEPPSPKAVDAVGPKKPVAERVEPVAVPDDTLAVKAAQAAERVANAVRELQEARAAEKAAEKVARAAEKRQDDARDRSREAEAKLEKARFWQKPAARVAQQEAQRSRDAAYEKNRAAEKALWGASRRADAAKTAWREAQANHEEAAHRDNFRGTPETVAEVEKTSAVLEAARRELGAARTMESEAQRALTGQNHLRGEALNQWDAARSQVWRAEQKVREARPWDKKEAWAAEKAAQRGLDAAEKKLTDIRAAQDGVRSGLGDAQQSVKAAEQKVSEAWSRACEAARVNDLQATRDVLQARTDLTQAEKLDVSQYLSRDACARLLRECESPQQAIAVGSICCGLRGADEATKGMEKAAADNVAALVREQREEEEYRMRQNSRSRGLDRGLDRGLSM